jgi:hypothetical protein
MPLLIRNTLHVRVVVAMFALFVFVFHVCSRLRLRVVPGCASSPIASACPPACRRGSPAWISGGDTVLKAGRP